MTPQKNTTARRTAREIAFQFLYGSLPAPANPPVPAVPPGRGEFESACATFGLPADEFAWELVEGTWQNIPTLDDSLARISTNWRLERMPRVDLTVLRLAAFEILCRPDVPRTVSINEAVELAKRFGSEDSPSFVNGVLDKLSKPE